jgi:hypothetical protein
VASLFHENSLSTWDGTNAVPPPGAAEYLFDRRASVVADRPEQVRAVTGAPGALFAPIRVRPTLAPMFDPDEMVARFRARAEAVRTRGIPPIEGPERQRFREQAQRDFTDYAMIGDAQAELVDGILTLRIDLRPKE